MNADGLSPESTMKAYGLPNTYYTDPAILAHEVETLFKRTWQIIGREEDLTNPGDYLTCTLAGEPIVVVRNDENVLRALHNVCAHRGMRLAADKGTCKRFVCPYHSWTYDLNGQLQAVPFARYLPEEFDKSNIRLVSIQVATWGGFVFINLDPAAESLERCLGEMVKRWEDYHPDWEGLREVKRIVYNEPCNWKIFMENATDYYHIPFIHQGSLGLPPIYRNRSSGLNFMLTTVTPEENYSRFFDLLFPNNYFHVAPNKIQLYRVVPETPERSHIEVLLYQTPAQMENYPLDDPDKHRDVDQIMEEDFSICRVLQQQANSEVYRVRYTAIDLEDGVNHFDSTLFASLQ